MSTDLNPDYFTAVFLASGPLPGRPESFAIITAWNPGGKEASPEENDADQRRLVEHLDRLGGWRTPVTGGLAGPPPRGAGLCG